MNEFHRDRKRLVTNVLEATLQNQRSIITGILLAINSIKERIFPYKISLFYSSGDR